MKVSRTIVRRTICFVLRLRALLFYSVALLILSGVTYAVAQNARDVINLFGNLVRAAIIEHAKVEWSKIPQNQRSCLEQRLQQQGELIRSQIDGGIVPDDIRLSAFRFDCRVALAPPPPAKSTAPLPPATEDHSQNLSAKPTFDCTPAKSGTARILCLDQEGAKADWDLSSAYYALKFFVADDAKDKFSLAHDKWFPWLGRACGLHQGQRTFSSEQRQCVLNGYRKRSASYRAKLRGDALSESWFSPEEHAEIQRALIARNYLDEDDDDGRFGSATRRAIKRFQAQSGFPEGEFLTAEQRQALLQRAPSQPEAPGGGSDEARLQCQSSDANTRFTGCTIIIEAKGFGSKKSLADALDGRCWASNDLKQYELALPDCKASIALNPRYSYAYNNLGTSLFGLGDIPNAIKAFTKAIELKPNFIYSRLSRAHAFVALENNELARKDFKYVLIMDSTNEEAKTGLDGLPPPPETENLKQARIFLEDIRKFIAEQTTVFPIPPIATEAANLQLALNKFDEASAAQSKSKLTDLLSQINGFEEFLKNRKAERELEVGRQLDQANTEGVKNIAFVDGYAKAQLGDLKTPSLMNLRQQIEKSISKQSIEEINRANGALQDYIKQNGLENSYRDIVKNFPTRPLAATSDTLGLLAKRVGATDKSMYLIQGPADDVVLIYNASPSAPKIWKNVRGDFVFQEDSASLCFTQSAPDVALVRYVERMLRHEGVKQVLSGPQPCALSVTASSIDIIAFQRGGLLKERENYIAVLVKLLEENTFRQYKIVTDYSGEKQRREALSLQIESDLERSVREGYGILAVSESGTMCVVPPKDSEQMDGLRALITRDRDLIGPNLTSDWQFVETTDDLAFRGVQRHQCGYVAGDLAALRTVMEALRREQLRYSFSPVWFDMKEVTQATFDTRDAREQEIRKREAIKQAETDAKRIEEQRQKDKQLQKGEREHQLRETNGVRARGLMSEINTFVKALAEKRDIDKGGSFSTYSSWLNKRFAEQWETYSVSSGVADFGTVQWNGRSLDAIIIKSLIQQKNRILGKYEDKCFLFGLVDDVEFAMRRESISAACDSGVKFITNWKVGKNFQTQWNAD